MFRFYVLSVLFATGKQGQSLVQLLLCCCITNSYMEALSSGVIYKMLEGSNEGTSVHQHHRQYDIFEINENSSSDTWYIVSSGTGDKPFVHEGGLQKHHSVWVLIKVIIIRTFQPKFVHTSWIGCTICCVEWTFWNMPLYTGIEIIILIPCSSNSESYIDWVVYAQLSYLHIFHLYKAFGKGGLLPHFVCKKEPWRRYLFCTVHGFINS